MRSQSLEILESSSFPPAQARAILQVMEMELGTEALATKADFTAGFASIKGEFAALRAEMVAMRKEPMIKFAMKPETGELKSTLFEIKTDLIRWMLILWVGQLVADFLIIRYLR